MQSEMGFPSSRQLKSYVASKSRLKLAARTVLSADAGLLVYRLNSTLGKLWGNSLENIIILLDNEHLLHSSLYGKCASYQSHNRD